MAYMNPDGSFENELGRLPVQVAAPTTGQTVTVTSGTRRLYLNTAGGLAAVTIKLPPGPETWQELVVNAKNAVTTLSWTDSNGNVVAGLAAALVASTPTVSVYGQMLPGGAKAWLRWS